MQLYLVDIQTSIRRVGTAKVGGFLHKSSFLFVKNDVKNNAHLTLGSQILVVGFVVRKLVIVLSFWVPRRAFQRETLSKPSEHIRKGRLS